jgi:hypothetical protein
VALEKEEERRRRRPLLLKYGNFLPTTMARPALVLLCFAKHR